MLIRSADCDDFDALVSIGHKFFEFNVYRHNSNIDNDSLRHTFWDLCLNHELLVVETDRKIIGTAGAYIAPVYWNHNELQGLEAFWWIDPEYRNSGVGTELRQVLQRRAGAKGVKFWNMIALKESQHEQVCQSYERAGMTHVETVYMKVL